MLTYPVLHFLGRYWLYLANTYFDLLPSLELDVGVKKQFVHAYCVRAKELHTELARLALFMDPRFKSAACNSGRTFQSLVELVRINT